jgi:hypothetical protein
MLYRVNRPFLISAVLLLAFASPVFALSITNDTPVTGTRATQEANPMEESSGTWDLDWSNVYQYNGSSSVAVDSHWILTAAHVADDGTTLAIDGSTYTPTETRYYDGSAMGSTNKNDATRDLALVRFNATFSGYYGYATGTGYSGDDVILVGFGYDGVVAQTSKIGSWTQLTNREQRWGTNAIDGQTPVTDAYGTYNMLMTSLSGKAGNQNNTDFETGVNVYDSGGPMLVKDGEWIVAGINVRRSGDPFDRTYSVPVGDYSTWIGNVIPEPATMSLLGLGGIALIRRRRHA